MEKILNFDQLTLSQRTINTNKISKKERDYVVMPLIFVSLSFNVKKAKIRYLFEILACK